MLQLKLKDVDIYRISKLLVKYNIKASITNQVITLEGEISDELLNMLCNEVTICSVQNFGVKIPPIVQKEPLISNADESNSKQVEDKPIIASTKQDAIIAPQTMQNYNLIYPTVKRGEVYLCDLGEPYGREQGNMRYVIVIQNDVGNTHSNTTIVLPCTTQQKKELPVHHHFVFSIDNMFDYIERRVGSKENVVMAEQIRTVDKKRLRKYIGTMTPEFMDNIQEIIDISLHLNRTKKCITKTEKVYIDKPVYINQCRDLNMVQIKLLSMVNIDELFKISQTIDSNEIKIEKILHLFGFDMQKNGVQYLLKAILISPKTPCFTFETLCENISKNEPNIEKNEIQRLIIARIKERFKFKKSPTSDFIRLINSFLTKKED